MSTPRDERRKDLFRPALDQIAERCIQQLSGVTSIFNLIVVQPPVLPAHIRDRIAAAFKRDATIDRQAIGIQVDSWREREAADDAARATAGQRRGKPYRGRLSPRAGSQARRHVVRHLICIKELDRRICKTIRSEIISARGG